MNVETVCGVCGGWERIGDDIPCPRCQDESRDEMFHVIDLRLRMKDLARENRRLRAMIAQERAERFVSTCAWVIVTSIVILAGAYLLSVA